MGLKHVSYQDSIRFHLTGPDNRFYKRSECPIPNSLYTQDILNDYFKVLAKMNVIKHKYPHDMISSYLRRIPHSKQNR